MAYDVTLDGSTFRTMMGIDPEKAAELMDRTAPTSSRSTAAREWTWSGPARRSSDTARVTDLPVMAQPNAGLPKLVEMKVVYDETPEEMVRGVVPLLAAGANIVGGCCGSTPDHIRAFRRAIDEYIAVNTLAPTEPNDALNNYASPWN